MLNLLAPKVFHHQKRRERKRINRKDEKRIHGKYMTSTNKNCRLNHYENFKIYMCVINSVSYRSLFKAAHAVFDKYNKK